MGQSKSWSKALQHGDIAAGDPPSDLASSVPALILPTPDGSAPPSDLAFSVPALSLPTPDGPALSDPTPDGYTHKHAAELGKYKLQETKHKVGYDASIKH